jgi:NhaA family Na+:H+ antiporter
VRRLERQSVARRPDTAALGSELDHEPQTLVSPVDGGDHRLGSRSALAALVEYGDYECPFCAQAAGPVRDLVERLGDDLLFVFRHFPLVSQHPHAFHAAVAAEAAAAQGRFWEMHDRLLANQRALGAADLVAHGRAIGLDLSSFEAALADPALADRVRRDAAGGLRSGVLGTPTFFVNGRRLEGGLHEAELEAAIRAALRSGAGGDPGDRPQ